MNDKNYLELATRDAGDFEHKDLLFLIANLYERLDRLNELEANEAQSKDEIKDAKLLFKECDIIDPSECDAYDIDPKDSVEVHKCKATGWHYLYDPKAEVLPYYCCITLNTGEFDRLEDLQNWARPLYFQ